MMTGSQEALDRFERQTAWPMMILALNDSGNRNGGAIEEIADVRPCSFSLAADSIVIAVEAVGVRASDLNRSGQPGAATASLSCSSKLGLPCYQSLYHPRSQSIGLVNHESRVPDMRDWSSG